MPTYPTSTAPRRAYDADGSLVRTITGTTPSTPSDADIAELNNSSATGGIAVGSHDWLAVVFPTTITIDAMFLAHGGAATSLAIQTSPDTTNGGDGTWTSAGTVAVSPGATTFSGALWRSELGTGLDLTCKGVRVAAGSTAWRTWHIHGGGPDQDPSGLVIRSSEYGAFPDGVSDWGRVPRASSADLDVFVVNTTTRDATGVVLAFEAAEDDDSFAVQHYLSTDDRNFSGTLYLGVIGANSRSPKITVRRVTPAGAATGARAARLVAAAAGWE